jgi:hypothetical protein
MASSADHWAPPEFYKNYQIFKWFFLWRIVISVVMKRSHTLLGFLICYAILLLTYFAAIALSQAASGVAVKKLVISEENGKELQRLGNYPYLESLELSCLEDLQFLPESIGVLTRLRELRIDNGNGCQMNPVLPESMGNLHSLGKLTLYGAQDPRYPPDARVAPLLRNRHKFPNSMSQLKNLTYLDLGRNGLEKIPEFVKDLPNLQELGFEWNIKLTKIPEFLSSLRELRTLRLNADGLNDLPGFLNQLPNLTLITLGDNCRITQSAAKKRNLQRRFPQITFDFQDEYDCPLNGRLGR